MNPTDATPGQNPAPSPEDQHAALFASLVLQQSNMAMMFLGKMPNPESGQTTKDLPAAQMFIGMLEMLEARTRGNLSAPEAGMLKESLMSLRMAFVEAANETPAPTPANQPAADVPTKEPVATAPAEAKPEAGSAAEGASDESTDGERRRKFVKKY